MSDLPQGTGLFLALILPRVERGIYKAIGVDPAADQKWSEYLRSMLAFSAVSVLFLYGLERFDTACASGTKASWKVPSSSSSPRKRHHHCEHPAHGAP